MKTEYLDLSQRRKSIPGATYDRLAELTGIPYQSLVSKVLGHRTMSAGEFSKIQVALSVLESDINPVKRQIARIR